MLDDEDLVVAVCDNAYEQLRAGPAPDLHWSVPDPAPSDTDPAFEAAYTDLAGRVDRLAAAITQFAGVFGTETIERFLYSSFDQFASQSTVPNFLPLLAERFARQRLTALAPRRRQARRRSAGRAVPVRSQRRSQPDGPRPVRAPR